MPSRREFVSAALVGLGRKTDRRVEGTFVNESQIRGHAIRDRKFVSAPRKTEKVPLVIVGGGIAGLSAAWWLDRKGMRDFVLLEMEPEPGGNSRWGQNAISAYPWGAHYVPVPGAKLELVRELMEDLGILRNGTWEERWLCHSPQERVYLHGRWQEGFEPETSPDRAEWKRFEQRIEDLAATGEFTIPVRDHSKLADLDRISMQQWLDREGFRSQYLRWYVDYACRDDYGSQASGTSAWMGIHYFASREHDERGPLTWPEGNGWIVRQLLRRLSSYIRTNQPVISIQPQGRNTLAVHTPDTLILARSVIYAAPTFTLPYVTEGFQALARDYSPWITANLTLDRMPAERGFGPAWDNVIAGAPSLGYVVATHMNLQSYTKQTVWTWYHALAGADTRTERTRLLNSSWTEWKDFILNDLSRAHPDIRECVSRIDIMRFGHAMARPVPGSLFRHVQSPHPALLPANSDLSGYSIFEEAQYRGVNAARRSLLF